MGRLNEQQVDDLGALAQVLRIDAIQAVRIQGWSRASPGDDQRPVAGHVVVPPFAVDELLIRMVRREAVPDAQPHLSSAVRQQIVEGIPSSRLANDQTGAVGASETIEMDHRGDLVLGEERALIAEAVRAGVGEKPCSYHSRMTSSITAVPDPLPLAPG